MALGSAGDPVGITGAVDPTAVTTGTGCGAPPACGAPRLKVTVNGIVILTEPLTVPALAAVVSGAGDCGVKAGGAGVVGAGAGCVTNGCVSITGGRFQRLRLM